MYSKPNPNSALLLLLERSLRIIPKTCTRGIRTPLFVIGPDLGVSYELVT